MIFTFKRTNDNFEDILKDDIFKKNISVQIHWENHLLIGLYFNNEKEELNIKSYILFKYGDYLTKLSEDYTPKPNIDYTPGRIESEMGV